MRASIMLFCFGIWFFVAHPDSYSIVHAGKSAQQKCLEDCEKEKEDCYADAQDFYDRCRLFGEEMQCQELKSTLRELCRREFQWCKEGCG